jgi:cardiolipin synthase (CMP-forming)
MEPQGRRHPGMEPQGRRHSAMEPQGRRHPGVERQAPVRDRVLTVPNALSLVRLVLIVVFLWLLLVEHADAWATGILMVSGASDWLDGKIARLMDQSSRLGELLDPAVDRIYMISIPISFALRHFVPWWFVITLIARDVLLAATLPALRGRGLNALPVTYIGKGATFALMFGFPVILLGQFDGLAGRVVLAIGWGFTIWGFVLYLWSFVLYVAQFVLVVRRVPKVRHE